MDEDDEMTPEDIKLKQELDRMLAKVREAVERLEAMPTPVVDPEPKRFKTKEEAEKYMKWLESSDDPEAVRLRDAVDQFLKEAKARLEADHDWHKKEKSPRSGLLK